GQSRKIIDEIQRVLDLVRNSGGKLTERGKFLGLYQAVLCSTQVLQRGGQFAGASLNAFKQANILDCDCCLIGEGLDQCDLFISKRPDLRFRESDDALRNSFAEHRDGEHSPKSEYFLGLIECVFRVSQCIDDLHWTALEQGSAHRASAASADWGALPYFQKFGWQIVGGHRAADIAVVTENHASLGATEPDGRTQESIEDHLQIERRAADDLEHVGGSGLLLERFTQFVEQASILDGDDGLRSEGLHERHLLIGEGFNL